MSLFGVQEGLWRTKGKHLFPDHHIQYARERVSAVGVVSGRKIGCTLVGCGIVSRSEPTANLLWGYFGSSKTLFSVIKDKVVSLQNDTIR